MNSQPHQPICYPVPWIGPRSLEISGLYSSGSLALPDLKLPLAFLTSLEFRKPVLTCQWGWLKLQSNWKVVGDQLNCSPLLTNSLDWKSFILFRDSPSNTWLLILVPYISLHSCLALFIFVACFNSFDYVNLNRYYQTSFMLMYFAKYYSYFQSSQET